MKLLKLDGKSKGRFINTIIKNLKFKMMEETP